MFEFASFCYSWVGADVDQDIHFEHVQPRFYESDELVCEFEWALTESDGPGASKCIRVHNGVSSDSLAGCCSFIVITDFVPTG